MTVKTFSPIQLEKGDFRISLHLSALADRGIEVMHLAQELGFPQSRLYKTDRGMWAVLLDEKHDFETSSLDELLIPWDAKLDELRSLLPDPDQGLVVAGRFKRDLM